MPKVKTLKYQFKGKEETVNVNVTSKGNFSANLPDELSTALKLRSPISGATLIEVEKLFFAALERYKQATITEELFLLIRYKSSGFYTRNSIDSLLFHSNDNYYLDQNWDKVDAIGFEFKIAIKETIDNLHHWHEAKKGKELGIFKQEDKESEKYYKYGKISDVNKWKQIPFSDAALNTLTLARENLRKLSEMLFTFISKDEQQIENILTHGRLLGNITNPE